MECFYLPKAASVPAIRGWLQLLNAKSGSILGISSYHKMYLRITSPTSTIQNDSSVPVLSMWSRINLSRSNFSITLTVSRCDIFYDSNRTDSKLPKFSLINVSSIAINNLKCLLSNHVFTFPLSMSEKNTQNKDNPRVARETDDKKGKNRLAIYFKFI